MNLKTSAIALAVAGAVAAPVVVQADSGAYFSVRIGLEYKDTGGKDDIIVRGYGSRFGFKGETDMGNGLTGFGKYEVQIDTDTADLNISGRHALVGVKGDFGSVTLGRTYHTYYNFISGPLDNPWWGSGDVMLAYTGRTSQGATYAGDFGGFSLGGTLYMNSDAKDSAGDNETLDGYEFAGAFDAGPIRLALGYQLLENDESLPLAVSAEPTIGITASGWELGIVTLGLGYALQDGEGTSSATMSSIVLDILIGNGYVHYEMLDSDTAGVGDPTSLTLGYTQSLGRQTTLWYEYQIDDADTGVSNDDSDIIRAVLNYTWK